MENDPQSVTASLLTLKLSIDEINLILESLGNQPYAKVFQLIEKIRGEANEQLSNSQG